MTDYAAPTIDALDNGALAFDPNGKAWVSVNSKQAWFGSTLELFVRDEGGALIYSGVMPVPNRDRIATWEIALERFRDYLDKPLKAYYTLTKQGVPAVQSAVLLFTVKDSFDAPMEVDLTADNHLVFYNSYMTLIPPPRTPAYAQFTRALSQAAGYISSDPDVASVDASGRVSILGNSPAESPLTITAVDAAGTPLASYTLSIRGIRELNLLSAQPDLDAAGAARIVETLPGFRLPNADEFRRLNDLYAQPGLGIAQYLKLPGKGLLGGADNAGNVTFFDFEAQSVTSVDATQKGYAVGITGA